MTADEGASVPEDLWEGMTDENGFPPDLDDVYGDDTAPHVSEVQVQGASAQEMIAARYRLPEEFWGARELFKTVRQAAWASQNHPDAVLACVLTRAAGAAGHKVTFDSGTGSLETLSLFACLLAPSGIGKTKAQKAANRVVQLPSYLLGPDGVVDMDVFPDGLSIGSGEGIAETFMGTVEKDTGKMIIKGKGGKPEPEIAKVRAVVRHRSYFFVDEGEALTKLMRERQGSTLGPTLRTSWSGGTLSQANATEDRRRFVPGNMYSIGITIGYQPDTAVDMLTDVGPGTPQRFLWFGAQDTEMPHPDTEFEWPEPIVVPPEDGESAHISFPPEVRRWLRHQHAGKHHGSIVINPLDSQEPMMRCKLSALLCYLDGRRLVTRDDWILAGMIWSVSTAIRDRLIRHRDAALEQAAEEKRTARLAEAQEIAVMQVSVSAEVEQVARRIWRAVSEAADKFETVKRYVLKKNFGRQKPLFDVGLAHARSLGWISAEESGGVLEMGVARPD